MFKKLTLGIFLILSLGGFNTQADKSKLLMQRWILIDFQTPRLEKNFELSGITEEKRDKVMKDLVEGSFVDFKPDGTYRVSILGSDPETLFWKLSSDDTKLFVRKRLQEQPKSIDLEVLTRQELIMVLPDVEGEYTRMYFVPADAEAGVSE